MTGPGTPGSHAMSNWTYPEPSKVVLSIRHISLSARMDNMQCRGYYILYLYLDPRAPRFGNFILDRAHSFARVAQSNRVNTRVRELTPRLARTCYCYLESKAQARFGTTSARMHMVNQLLCARASTQPHAVTASRQGAVAAPSLVRQLNSQTRLSIQRRGRYVQLVRFHITIPTLIILQVQRYFSNKIIETIVWKNAPEKFYRDIEKIGTVT